MMSIRSKVSLIIAFCSITVFSALGFCEAGTESGGGELRVGIADAISAAVRNNYDVLAGKTDPAIAGKGLAIEESYFDLSVFGSASRTKNLTPSTSAFAKPEVGETSGDSIALGIKQRFTPGTEYELSIESIDKETNSLYVGVNPEYDRYLKLAFNQPLLKGRGKEVNTTGVFVARNVMKMSEESYRKKVMDSVTVTIDAYWEAVYLAKELAVREESLRMAKDLLEQIELKVKVGVLAPIEIAAAKATVAVREEELIGLRQTIGNNNDKLKALMNIEGAGPGTPVRVVPVDEPGTPVRVVPVDEPGFIEQRMEIDVLKKIAYAKRSDCIQARFLLENREREMRFGRNQMLPKLDLTGSVRLKGIRGDGRVSTDISGNPTESMFSGTPGDALDDMSSGDYYDYSIGVVAEMPLFNRSGRSYAARAELEYQKAKITEEKTRQTADMEVMAAIREVESAAQRVVATRASRLLSEEKFKAETKKYEVGATTSFIVLEYQKDLAAEKSKEIKAVTDHLKAIAHLRLATGETLEKYGIALEFGSH